MSNPHPPQVIRRIVRFCINPDGSTLGDNSYAGKPSMAGLGRYYELTLSVRGHPDPQTGYLIGIQEIDALVRTHLVPVIADQIRDDATIDPGRVLDRLWAIAEPKIKHELFAIRWQLTPYHSVEMTNAMQQSSDHAGSVLVRQRFDFAAAHRLHAPHLSDAENAQFFGKCNNLNGHGHNYQLEPCVRVPIALLDRSHYQIEIQQMVNSVLLDTLDHKFLNQDCPWFDQSKGGVIPSVENIAKVCYEQLAPSIAQIAQGIELVSMSAWETEKTSSTYPG
tara:strand:- start:91707 stop:92540 length:834 start_codon:yes stop_codon:yes gene_type:complete